MKKIKINDISNYELFNDRGAMGNIYYTDSEDILMKIFKRNIDKSDYKKWKLLSKIDLDYFTKPLDLIYFEEKYKYSPILKGYTMNKKEGMIFEKIAEIDNLILIKNLLIAMEKLEDDLKKLSSNKIRIFDLHDRNILYNNEKNEINVIDTDGYGCGDCYDIFHSLYYENLLSVAHIVLYCLHINSFNIKNVKTMKDLIKYISEKINKFEYLYNKDIKSLNDIRSLNRTKKRILFNI